jgi:transcription termination factor NusB
MTEFEPEKFEDKYANYFPELQTAYRNAFEQMNDRYDSDLVHAIDQQVLNESEPFYEDDGFRLELPDNPEDRVTGVLVDEEKLDAVLAEYIETIEAELADVFDLDEGSPKA